ncbi:UvrD-helicase domain-containing protein [Gorillibacterium timonense]|uniref:UvrD-helicase domain-containing protein n=1 Tax=Gorillibacterium timonense TaxID=1689269 RepID=UPI00071E35C6|nr:UvrD-helicase domain-containing protein [Gorillibacterium timonense]
MSGWRLGAKPVGSTWTDEQWQAIACRGQNTLVAAAAGSGKTAVLVERIIRRVCDEANPLDVDRLLVATFTNAAAAEMRERIRSALENELTKNPSSRHLRSQLALLPRASITTLHSLCLEVIRRHYRTIGLDPGFRIANETEAELIKQELIEELVDSRFASSVEGDGFWLLADGFGGEKGDGQLFKLIATLYEASRSHPAPAAWVAEMASRFAGAGEDLVASTADRSGDSVEGQSGGSDELRAAVSKGRAVGASLWFASLQADVRLELSGIIGLLEEAGRIASLPAGPLPYKANLSEEAEVFRHLLALADGEWDELQAATGLSIFGRLKPCRGDDYDKVLQKAAQELRDGAKARWAKMKEELFDRTRADYESELQHMAPVMDALARLIIDFADQYGAAKREKGLVDFSDLEHYALQILSGGTDAEGKPLPSEAALEYRNHFEEVLLDEYQDTNRVQETIVSLISRPGAGNRFLVGDVKQSIYRFRLAEPGLFLEKYKAYRKSVEGAIDQEESSEREEAFRGRAGAGLRIDLARNFRSRTDVVNGVNYLFRQIMEERVGEIRYDASAELVPGARYPEVDADLAVEAVILDKAGQTELLQADEAGTDRDGTGGKEAPTGSRVEGAFASQISGMETASTSKASGTEAKGAPKAGEADAEKALRAGSESGDGTSGPNGETGGVTGDNAESADEEGAWTRQEQETARLEARFVAERIHQLMGQGGHSSFPVSAKGSEQARPLAYRDIVILMRSTAGWAPLFAEELGKAGIPVYAELGSGFFSAVEVEVMLSLLKVIDNPYQDIPLAGVLHSPLFGFSADELAQLRVHKRDGAFYDAVLAYGRPEAGSGVDVNPELADKLYGFQERLDRWRRDARQMTVAELIWRLYRETKYYDFVGGLPGGIQRQANLRALHDRAKQYESTSFRGLFRFLRFLNRMRESGGDLGAARSLGEQEDVVKIMTIHKSKGLEFPVVFVAGLSKPFNRQDLNGSFLLHKDLGFGPKYIDLGLRLSYPSLATLAIRRRLKLEALAEEMRVLYVALTRAREKLILVGTVKDAAKETGQWLRAGSGDGETLPDYELASASCYLDWIGPALIRHPDAEEWLHVAGAALALPGQADPSRWKISVLPADSYAQARTDGQNRQEEGNRDWLDALRRGGQLPLPGTGLAEEVNRRLSWTYPHEAVTRLITKTTVSELKRLAERQQTASEEEEAGIDGLRMIPGIDRAEQGAEGLSVIPGIDRVEQDAEDLSVIPGVRAEQGAVMAADGTAGKADGRRVGGKLSSPMNSSMMDMHESSASAGSSFPATKAAVFRRPKFAEHRGLNAAERGTVYHAVLQRLPLHPDLSEEDVLRTVEQMTARRLLTAEQAAVVAPAELFRFFQTEIGRRLLFAGRVERELPFSLKLKAGELYPGLQGKDAEETILVQGIIDCLFEDAGGLVLLDYKTDSLWREEAAGRAERYRIQLELYAKAVEQIRHRKPAEIHVYFFDGAQSVKLIG